jgi:heme-degrading monooxygenase HmoA
MIAVIFEAEPRVGQHQAYLSAAAALRPKLDQFPGFVSIERYESLTKPGKLLSLSFWDSEESVVAWRNVGDHRATQAAGRHHIFADYRLRVANVLRDYGLNERIEAPVDSHLAHPSWEGST